MIWGYHYFWKHPIRVCSFVYNRGSWKESFRHAVKRSFWMRFAAQVTVMIMQKVSKSIVMDNREYIMCCCLCVCVCANIMCKKCVTVIAIDRRLDAFCIPRFGTPFRLECQDKICVATCTLKGWGLGGLQSRQWTDEKVFTCQCPTLEICLFRFGPISRHVLCPFYRRHVWIILRQRSSWRRSANGAQRQQPWWGSSCLCTTRAKLMRIQLLLHTSHVILSSYTFIASIHVWQPQNPLQFFFMG